MQIKKHFEVFTRLKEYEESEKKLKQFNFLDRKKILIDYLNKNKAYVLKKINYSFFESDEPYLLSVFTEKNSNFIHINSRLSKNFPVHYISKDEYENFLAIYGTFAVLIGQSFQIENMSDSRIKIYIKDFLYDLTFKIYYDDAFRLNLQDYIKDKNKILRYVYKYGYDYLFILFRAYFNEKIDFVYISKILDIELSELEELFRLYKNKILIK